MELIYLLLLVTFVSSIETAGEPCSTVDHLPVVNVCTDKTQLQNNNDSILIQANIVQNCTCQLSVINQDRAISVNIQKFNQDTNSSPSDYRCGLILKFFKNEDDYIWDAQCIVDNRTKTQSIPINETITIISLTAEGTLKTNEGYCIEIKKAFFGGSRNKLKLNCGVGSTNIISTTQSGEKTTTITRATPTTTTTIMPIITTGPTTVTTTESTTTQTATVPTTTTTTVPTTTKTSTGSFTNTDGSVATNQANRLNMKDNDDTITIAVGASVGGFVIIISATIVVCLYSRRNHPKSTSKPGPVVDTNNDDYGLRENVLYVSSEPSDTNQTPNNADIPTTNRISVNYDGNYSTVDLDEVPQEEVTIADDVYSVPDKKRVKHVTAPGENGCEYAVISKPNKSKVDKSEDQPSTSNVYAVVEKKKRMSDGKGTNQKRDSSTAKNDGETGQS